MGINMLLENPPSQSKPWCNIYVDTLTAYKGIKLGENAEIGDRENIDIPIKEAISNDAVGDVRAAFIQSGNVVTFRIDQFAHTIPIANGANSYVSDGVAVPADMIPSQDTYLPIIVKNNGEKTPGTLLINDQGEISIYLNTITEAGGVYTTNCLGNFPVDVETGIENINATYII